MELPLPPAQPGMVRRVAFLGTPEIAVPTLRAVLDAGFEIPLVVSGADKRRGRGKTLSPTPVKQAAVDLGLAVTTDVDDLLAEHARAPIDLAVVVAFGQIIRPHVLAEIPMVNVHFSPLPRWRGAAPVERAILTGDTESAVVIMTVAEGLDEGDIWATRVVPIGDEATLESLWTSMAIDGAELTVQCLQRGFVDPKPQVGEITYARKIRSADLRVDWTQTAAEVCRVIRVGNAWTTYKGERFKIHAGSATDGLQSPGEVSGALVGTSEGCVLLDVVQPAGKPRMEFSAWANGAKPDGERFE